MFYIFNFLPKVSFAYFFFKNGLFKCTFLSNISVEQHRGVEKTLWLTFNLGLVLIGF